VYREDPTSFIAFALNSKSFANAMIKETDSKEIKIRMTMINQNIPNGNFREPISELMDSLKIEIKMKDYKDTLYQVTIFHHAEFEHIRNSEGIIFQDWDALAGTTVVARVAASSPKATTT
jgi:chromosome condensin MukBEF ATPase and DNA-binding subunit MukB